MMFLNDFVLLSKDNIYSLISRAPLKYEEFSDWQQMMTNIDKTKIYSILMNISLDYTWNTITIEVN